MRSVTLIPSMRLSKIRKCWGSLLHSPCDWAWAGFGCGPSALSGSRARRWGTRWTASTCPRVPGASCTRRTWSSWGGKRWSARASRTRTPGCSVRMRCTCPTTRTIWKRGKTEMRTWKVRLWVCMVSEVTFWHWRTKIVPVERLSQLLSRYHQGTSWANLNEQKSLVTNVTHFNSSKYFLATISAYFQRVHAHVVPVANFPNWARLANISPF